MGRSRGGLTTKIHAVVDANGLPITLKLTPGQAHDGKSADDMLATVKAGDTLIADAGYDTVIGFALISNVGAHPLPAACQDVPETGPEPATAAPNAGSVIVA